MLFRSEAGERHHGEGEQNQGDTGERGSNFSPTHVRDAEGESRHNRAAPSHVRAVDRRGLLSQLGHLDVELVQHDQRHDHANGESEESVEDNDRCLRDTERGMNEDPKRGLGKTDCEQRCLDDWRCESFQFNTRDSTSDPWEAGKLGRISVSLAS